MRTCRNVLYSQTVEHATSIFSGDLAAIKYLQIGRCRARGRQGLYWSLVVERQVIVKINLLYTSFKSARAAYLNLHELRRSGYWGQNGHGQYTDEDLRYVTFCANLLW